MCVVDAGAAVLPATGAGSNKRAPCWDRGMLIAHLAQAALPNCRHASWLACTVARNCKHQCLCSSLCEVLDVHVSWMHNNLPAKNIFGDATQHHTHSLSGSVAEWSSIFLNVLSTALLLKNSFPACVERMCLQKGKKLTDSKS